MKRWLISTVLVGLLASIVPAAAQVKVQASQSSNSLGYASLYVAMEMGYFKQAGVEIELIPTTSGPQGIAAVASGKMDTVLGQATTMSGARRAGGDIVMFAALSTQYGANIVISKKWAEQHRITVQSSYKDRVAALKGINMGINSIGGAPDQLVRFLAKEAGLNPDRDLTIISIADTSGLLAAFSQNRIDGLSAAAPTTPQAIYNGGVSLFNLSVGDIDYLNGYFGSTIATRSSWLKENAATATKIAMGLQKALDAMHDPAQTNTVREAVRKAQAKDMDPALFSAIWSDVVKAAPTTPAITRKMVTEVFDFANRFAKDQLDVAQADSYFSNEYVERALADLSKK